MPRKKALWQSHQYSCHQVKTTKAQEDYRLFPQTIYLPPQQKQTVNGKDCVSKDALMILTTKKKKSVVITYYDVAFSDFTTCVS